MIFQHAIGLIDDFPQLRQWTVSFCQILCCSNPVCHQKNSKSFFGDSDYRHAQKLTDNSFFSVSTPWLNQIL